jgi:hypothetical protein
VKIEFSRDMRVWLRNAKETGGPLVRILCWFPDERVAVVALVAGDKKKISEEWYDSATPRAEAAIDQWLRELRSET